MLALSILFAFSLLISTLEAKIGFGPGEQDWDHVTVRDGAHLFYWLYYTTANVVKFNDRPLVIWLQGGPGASSTGYGNFEELGPIDLDLNKRNYTWVKDVNVMFIDNPVGSGFSYVDNFKFLTKSNKQIAIDLVELMKHFYLKHPEFKNTPLHIFSESYGGKMAVEFAIELNNAIKKNEIESNFQSVALGDSWIHPVDLVKSWAPLLLHTGIVDHKGYNNIKAAAQKVENAMKAGNTIAATNLWAQTQGAVLRESEYVDFYNILTPLPSEAIKFYRHAQNEDIMRRTLLANNMLFSREQLLEELMRKPVSRALNIPKNVVWGSQSSQTFSALYKDFMNPVVDKVEELLNKTDIHVIVYTGQLDLICATPGTVEWLRKMEWKYKNDYENQPRNGFYVNGILEGYKKLHKKFSMYWVNRAGHMVPTDNPAGMDYILKQVTKYDS